MTDKATLLALAERVEGLDGPDRELDALIRCALFAPAGAFIRQSPINGAWCIYETGLNGKERLWEARGLSQLQRLGAFTASIDAALTLVPEGWQFEIEIRPCQALVIGEGVHRSIAATPALALTAAALRAHAETQP
jgi:hypothetical protein